MSCGVVYIAFGDRYRAEARRSLRSLRKVSDVAVAVFTDQEWSEEPVPNRFIVRPAIKSFHGKIVCLNDSLPFDRTLYLDTDTVVASDPSPIFGLLDHYDVGVRFGGPWLAEPDGLHFHKQCQGGVVLLKKTDATRDMLRRWQTLYDAAPPPADGDWRGANDQRYLAIAIALSSVRPVHLETYLNFTLFDTVATASPPVIYHGRKPWMERLAAHIAITWDRKTDWHTRVWSPNISGFLPRGVRRSDPLLALALLFRRMVNEIRLRR